jgi:hypothetical protein
MTIFRAFLFLILSAAPLYAEYNCGGYTCKCGNFRGIQQAECKQSTDDGTFVSLWFQCDASGNVKMDSSGKIFNHPQYKNVHDATNNQVWDFHGGACYGNCCYSDSGEFLGQFNQNASCQNLCCPTLKGYMARNCSVGGDNNNPPNEPTPEATVRPEPTIPDLIPESSIPDKQIGF